MIGPGICSYILLMVDTSNVTLLIQVMEDCYHKNVDFCYTQ